ncbi:pentapeptide repeat-containing protein [Streptomyces sp. UG1]|uniref:pentapeptide repeat-containing protein n=1 Tax=Streptomyces sp. UG1 TaxID=3417652 RepID=UPI003CF0D6C0
MNSGNFRGRCGVDLVVAEPSTNPAPPEWPHCGHGSDPATVPVGCRGIHVPGHTACLAHLADADRDAYLAGLTPGDDIDHRRTPFTELLLSSLLHALRDPSTGKPQVGNASFEGAQFSGNSWFDEAQFSGSARFNEAQFSSDAWFVGAQFSDNTVFDQAQFSGVAAFERAQFSGYASFSEAQFSGDAAFEKAKFSDRTDFDEAQFSRGAGFDRTRFSDSACFGKAQFSGEATFYKAQFSDSACFDGTQFSGDAVFEAVRFAQASTFGPLACAGVVDLAGAVFERAVTLEIAAHEVRCERTGWESTATLRLRYAAIHLGHAVLSAPVAVTAHPAPLSGPNGTVDESLLSGCGDRMRLTSVQGVDAAHLVLTDIDLTVCLFSGAFHLDQLRLEGRTVFAQTPTGWHRRGMRLARWTRRRTLAEEHHWRAQTADQSAPPSSQILSPRDWRTGPHHPDPDLTPDPEDVAALYRQLRKAFEDGKNEPGAADFYYGEMEMRRHDRTGTPIGERVLLWAYWLLSGYGLRASRALGWLAASMLITIVLMMSFGLPQSSPKQEATGVVPPGGGKVTFEIDKEDPKNPTGNRFTGERFEKALNVTLNSVVFRSSGQDLTTAGGYIEMASRFSEPVLLGLAALAIRGRVKR